jgi:hypothetical protein
MSLTIDRREHDSLQALMTYRFFIGDERRLQPAVEQGVAHEQLAHESAREQYPAIGGAPHRDHRPRHQNQLVADSLSQPAEV